MIDTPRQAHALLLNKPGQQFVERLHDLAISGELKRSVRFDGRDTVILDVPRDEPGKHAPKIRGQFVRLKSP